MNGKPLRPNPVPSWDLPLVLTASQRAPFWADAVCRAENSVNKDSALNCAGFHQEGRGPACLFGQWIMPGIWADRLSRYPETPARICAQGSHHAFQGSAGEPEALPSEKADPALALLCPVRALHIYVDCMQSFRTSKQLFVCYRGQQKEKAVSK